MMVLYLNWIWLLTNFLTVVFSEFSGSLVGPKYFINNNVPTSQPLLFYKDFDSEVHVINNATLIVKKKKPSGIDIDRGYSGLSVEPQRYGVVHNPEEPFHYKRKKRPPWTPYIDNYYVASESNYAHNGGGITWSPPPGHQTIRMINNHKPWTNKVDEKVTAERPKASSPTFWTHKPYTTSTSSPLNLPPDIHQRFLINNHMTYGTRIRYKPPKTPKPYAESFNTVNIVDKVQKDRIVDILGDRVKQPDTIISPEITVMDASPNIKTTIKHKNLVVIQKRVDTITDTSIRPSASELHVVTSKPLITVPERPKVKPPSKHTVSSASASSNPWANIPIPSRPAWSSPTPPKGSATSTSQGFPSMFPSLPFMPFIASVLSPLLKKPLTPETVNTGMQGIKAMQGFLRNSLIGAMICFLPSALIAVSLNAAQRAEIRKTPHMEDMVVFCKTCLENLKTLKKFAREQPRWWEKISGHYVAKEML